MSESYMDPEMAASAVGWIASSSSVLGPFIQALEYPNVFKGCVPLSIFWHH